MARTSSSKSSAGWLKEHFDDQYVQRSWQDGYRSRASYKLLEIDAKDKLFKPGMTVIDLGAAPGGWSQIAAERVGDAGVVIASDILEMDALAGVDFIQGDFTEDAVLDAILGALGERPVDLIISDMAPNMSGMAAIDQPQAMYLVELALDLARAVRELERLRESVGNLRVSVDQMLEGVGSADAEYREVLEAYRMFAYDRGWIRKIEEAIRANPKLGGLTPRGIRTHLGLNKPIYQPTAAYGHFGRKPEGDFFPWEKTDLVEKLKAAL